MKTVHNVLVILSSLVLAIFTSLIWPESVPWSGALYGVLATFFLKTS
jgi:uncharacterized membrane protein YagU involved in acid resistance